MHKQGSTTIACYDYTYNGQSRPMKTNWNGRSEPHRYHVARQRGTIAETSSAQVSLFIYCLPNVSDMVVDLSRKTRLVFDWSTSCFEDSTRTIQLIEPWSQRIEWLHGKTRAGRFLSAVALDSESWQAIWPVPLPCVESIGVRA